MARPSIERRSRSRSVDDLRHDLREADEQRFYLESALNGAATDWLHAYNTQPPRVAHPIATHPVAKVAALCAVASLFLAGGLAWPVLRALDHGRTVPTAPTVAPLPAAAPAAAIPVVQAPVSLRSSSPVMTSGAPVRPPKVKRQNQIGRRVVPRRAVPRPLSPAEFGRHATPAS